MKINSGKQHRPRRVLLYGDNGIGKTTLAAAWPKPIIINLEDGCGDVECDKTERLTTEADVVGAISWLIQNKHDYRTIVVDSADWLERCIFQAVAQAQGKKTIEEIGFGKGYESAAKHWQYVIDGLTHLWQAGCHIVFTAHLHIAKFQNPAGDSYNYFQPALHDKGSSILIDWCDEILFLTTRVDTVVEESGFGAKRTRAIGGTERIVYTSESASHVAKNRCGMPPVLPMSAAELAKYMEPPNPTGNVAGIVVDGSSKGASVRTEVKNGN